MPPLTQLELNYLYGIYLAIFNLPGGRQWFHRKHNLFTNMWGFEWSWRVVGVTINALHTFQQINFDRPPAPNNIVRAHIIDRKAYSNFIFVREEPLDQTDLFSTFWQSDKVVLATREENRLGNLPEQILQINPEEGLFTNTGRTFSYSNAEAQHLMQLQQNYDNGVIILVPIPL